MEVDMKVKKKAKRTKFSPEQKNKMKQFAEKLGWRPQKHDEEEIEQFCDEVRISQKIFKVLYNKKIKKIKKIKIIQSILLFIIN